MKQTRLQLSPRAFWLCFALLVCLRCALSGFQQVYTWVGGVPLKQIQEWLEHSKFSRTANI